MKGFWVLTFTVLIFLSVCCYPAFAVGLTIESDEFPGLNLSSSFKQVSIDCNSDKVQFNYDGGGRRTYESVGLGSNCENLFNSSSTGGQLTSSQVELVLSPGLLDLVFALTKFLAFNFVMCRIVMFF